MKNISNKRLLDYLWYSFFGIISLSVMGYVYENNFQTYLPIYHIDAVNAYEAFKPIQVPTSGKYEGVGAKGDIEVVVSYEFFEDNRVKKIITIKSEPVERYEDETTYSIKGSVIYFKDTGNGVFIPHPRPLKFNQRRGTMEFFGDGKLLRYEKVYN